MQNKQERSGVADLQSRLDEHPEDSRDVFLELTERMAHFRDNGEPVPECLAHFERCLLTEFRAESQGR